MATGSEVSRPAECKDGSVGAGSHQELHCLRHRSRWPQNLRTRPTKNAFDFKSDKGLVLDNQDIFARVGCVFRAQLATLKRSTAIFATISVAGIVVAAHSCGS